MGELQTTCHCGAVHNTVIALQNTTGQPPDIELCHCYGCRHSTGQLYATYCKIRQSAVGSPLASPSLTRFIAAEPESTGSANLTDMPEHGQGASVTLYFCSTCGCHVFRSVVGADDASLEVATGTLTRGIEGRGPEGQGLAAKFGPHVNVESTVDGGLTKWMSRVPVVDGGLGAVKHFAGNREASRDAALAASCLCERVSFRITRPNADSHKPQSGFADAIVPFHTQDAEMHNPKDVKWWLRQNDTRYLGGLCVCRSCRLASGFELQAWAFIPRANIEFRSRAGDHEEDGMWRVLDFDGLHSRGVTRGYESSPGVVREFCPSCGATVFWHDEWRPELIDVSAGLLRSHDGVRAESWLDWWTGRVSFAEDVALGRRGSPATRARLFLEALQEGLEASAGN
ncbi:Uncharacterized protein TCAP_00535 [Tolypocladium capitatum]|uniref:CENP-V/GFA domain-containing protein n=1 Tax=Tolypocladium capitatum TaxID=45235 RepID=A0A2K3QPU9_9HYPO|nr:Uncharacterized protein TCAP_00535 [Tolypocladium capitatum]